ncbi:MAG TPA: hypothetical protein VI456_13675 [Polyangia bacterium]
MAPSARAADPPAGAGAAPLGVTYAGWRGDFKQASRKLDTFKAVGFGLVAFVPNYAYVGLDKIDLASGPDAAELGAAVATALTDGFAVVIKPHLDPPAYEPGFDQFQSENGSWRVACPWRGFFDVDPMTPAYREGVVFGALRMLKEVLSKPGAAPAQPVRLELGVELMNSVVYGAEKWELLLAAAKKERHRLGLDGKVLLSHNFTHHLEIADDFVGRMTAGGRAALRRYIRGLDALSLSQYMDLTAAVPPAERGKRLPTVAEISDALVLAETNFRRDILVGALGLRPKEIPPLQIGEFGVGRGGLKHPNLWAGEATPAQEKALAHEIALGHAGLLAYLARPDGRTVGGAILWVTGRRYDIFGWENPSYANPEATAAIKAALGH